MAISVIWCGMLLLGIAFSLVCGRHGLSTALLKGSANAVTLIVSVAGSLVLWSGLGKLLSGSGLQKKLERLFRPLLGRLFPDASKSPAAFGPLCANVCANLLGLGNAATPFGVAAVKAMAKGTRATDEQCRFIVLNTASVQLIPTTVCALRASCGAAAPLSILPAVWLTSALSVTVGLLACRILRRWL
ncbi:MAG: spore maturation protein A [Clostridia bacterium]|nr:spore maturation protein A [Clostridia bacterium]